MSCHDFMIHVLYNVSGFMNICGFRSTFRKVYGMIRMLNGTHISVLVFAYRNVPNCFIETVLFDFKIFVEWCGSLEIVDKIFAEVCCL